MNTEEIHQFIKSRYSIRTFDDQPIPRELLEKVIEVARWAPSAHNRQPWKFLILETEAQKKKLVDAMSPSYRKAMQTAGIDDDAIQLRLDGRAQMINSAPVVILPIFTSDTMEEYPNDPFRAAGEKTMGVQSVAMAGSTLMLAAFAEGLRTVWMAAPMFTQKEVSKAFGLPAEWLTQAMILMGYPKTGLVPERVRFTVKDIIIYPEDEV